MPHCTITGVRKGCILTKSPKSANLILVTIKNKQRTTTMYTPKHKQESIPQSAFETPPQPYEGMEIPGLVPDDELTNTDIDAAFEHSVDTSINTQAEPRVESPGDALPFEIPELVPDDEYVPPAQLESTSPGALGFSIPRPRTPAPQRERSTMYAYGKQRAEQIQEVLDLAREREAQKEQSRAAYELSRQALSQTMRRPIDMAERQQ